MGIKPWYEEYEPSYQRIYKHKKPKIIGEDVNPQPNNYKIVKAEEVGDYLVIKINYPNCTNFEGNKILVFKATLLEIVNQKLIDPHFFEDKDYKSPIARFVPTEDGWKMAVDLVTYLARK